MRLFSVVEVKKEMSEALVSTTKMNFKDFFR